MEEITSPTELNSTIGSQSACLVYFSTDSCNVCKVLKPKVLALLSQHYPELPPFYINIEKVPEGAASQSVFSVPTIIIFFDGKETIRKSRNFGLEELRRELEKPYHMYFS